MSGKLFDTTVESGKWQQFAAEGFSDLVSGVVFRTQKVPCCGAPLGGISTGCLDMDVRGVWGFSSIFNPESPPDYNGKWRVPRKTPFLQPVLGLAVGEKTWVLTTAEMITGESLPWCTEPAMLEVQGKEAKQEMAPAAKIEDVQAVKDIHYWGHYPVVDVEYETDAPVSVGLRAWSPLIPGDTAASNIPAAVFEVHLRNNSAQVQRGTIAFNFPGPDRQEARTLEFTRQSVREDINGMLVSATNGWVNYLVGTLGDVAPRFGDGLCSQPKAWSQIAEKLPDASFREENGQKIYLGGASSAAVDFELASGAEQVVRFILAWYAPVVEGVRHIWGKEDEVQDGLTRLLWLSSPWLGDVNYFHQMYAARYSSSLAVARRIAVEHASLLERVLAWQKVIYNEAGLPVWLRESLVNNLALLAEDSHWFQGKEPLGDWAFPGGSFALNESPRGCPHMSCIPCDWYGNLPVVYFYPDLALSNLRAFKAYQLDSGEIAFAIGHIGELPDMATPEYYWQVSLNGMCYVDMVDRVWQAMGETSVLEEFYESVKKCNTFTMNLKRGPGGVISMPEVGGMEWFEYGEWHGMASHMGGLRLAMLRMVIRMAQVIGDTAYLHQCETWLEDGTRAMEQDLWTGSYYLNYWDKATGKKSDVVMGYQLDGEWTARYHGFEGVFQSDRVLTTLETIRRTNIALTPQVGAANFANPDGTSLSQDSKVAHYGLYAMFPPELVILAMTYIYAGEADFGLELARKHWETLCLQHGHIWDLPNIVRGDNGKRVFGTDYYQNMMLWAMPAAIRGEDIDTHCQSEGFVKRIIRAGTSPSPSSS